MASSARGLVRIGCLIACAVTLAGADSQRIDGITALGLRFVRNGIYQAALKYSRQALQANPDDADAFAIAGIAMAGLGRYPDAKADLELAVGSEITEADGLNARADVLRAFGHGRKAAQLRLQRLLNDPSRGIAESALAGAVEDLRMAGDLNGAWEVAWRYLARDPNGGRPNALLAEVLLDLAERGGPFAATWREEADFHLWLAERASPRLPLLQEIRARQAIADGDLAEAERRARAARHIRWRSPAVNALLADVYRREGDLGEAEEVVNRMVIAWSEDPALMAERTMILRDRGDTAAARAMLRRAVGLYPHHPDVQVAVEYLGEAPP